MIVRPVPVGAGSRSRRWLGALAGLLPIVLLAGVAGAGLLGPQPVSSVVDPSIAVLEPAASQAAPEATPPPVIPVARSTTRFPSSLAGLAVSAVGDVVAAQATDGAAGLVAVAGYLGLRAAPEACRDQRLGVFGAFCERSGMLAANPWAMGTSDDAAGPTLHLLIPVGVRVPHQATEVAFAGATAPPTVVIGRFDDPRAAPCASAGLSCRATLVVERVTWINGQDYPRTVTVDPGIMPDPGDQAGLRPAAASAAATLPAGSVALLSVLVRPGMIGLIDPSMAPVTSRIGAPAVWYVRSVRSTGEPASIDWVITDAVTGALLDRGSIPLAKVDPDAAPGGARRSRADASGGPPQT